MKMEQKLPNWSEAKEIQETNKSLSDLLKNLKILEQENPEHPSVKERKELSENNATKLNKLKYIVENNIPDWDMPEKLQKQLEIDEINDYIDYLKRHLDEPQTKNWNQVTAEEIIYDLKQELTELENL